MLRSLPRGLHRRTRRAFKVRKGYQGLFVLAVVGLALGLLGCNGGSIGGSGQCGGASDSDACVRIDSITPVYLGQNTSNVDAVRDICVRDDPTTPADETVLEPFTDHNAVVMISNSPLPGVGPISPTTVTLRDFSISYVLNACPAGATCPALDTLTAAQTVTIPPNSSVALTLPFVSLAKKFEYVSKGGSLLRFPTYVAVYTITGTDAFHNAVSVRGAAQFTIGDFDHCP